MAARRGATVSDDPAAIRRQIAATRAALADRLARLKQHVLDDPTPGAKPIMKTKKSPAAAKKTTAASKKKAAPSASKKTAAAGKKLATAAKKTAPKKKKAASTGAAVKKVLGKMLTGAAVGAVEGAVEAVAPAEGNGAKKADK